MRALVILGLSGCAFQLVPGSADRIDAAAIDAATDAADDAMSDASLDAPIDGAPVFDPILCPTSYTIHGATSWYRIAINGSRAWEHAASCAADRPGWTHLVTLNTPVELDAMEQAVDSHTLGIAGNRVWVGAVQLRNQSATSAGWLGFDGNPFVSTLWRGPVDPNDGSDMVENNDENFATIWKTTQLVADDVGTGTVGALCECDGRAVPANVTAAMAASTL